MKGIMGVMCVIQPELEWSSCRILDRVCRMNKMVILCIWIEWKIRIFKCKFFFCFLKNNYDFISISIFKYL